MSGAGGGDGGRRAGGANDHDRNPERTTDERPNQNENLRTAWAATGRSGIYEEGSPFRDESQRNNRKVIPSDTPNVRICLAMALRGRCYANCRGKHEALSEAEVRRVAEAGGLTLN